jgi:pyrimidine-nucleoside phosphorylase
LEVREAVDTLRGAGPEDFRSHCITVAAHMLMLAGKQKNIALARGNAERALKSGEALSKFRQLVDAQGGDARVCDDPAGILPSAPVRGILAADRAGWLAEAHAGRIGDAAVRLGAGRAKKGDVINPSVGFVLRVKVGDRLREGDALCEIHAVDEAAMQAAIQELRTAFRITRTHAKPLPLFYKTIR